MLVTCEITEIHLDKAEPATIPTCFGHGIIATHDPKRSKRWVADHDVLNKDSIGDDVVPRWDCAIHGFNRSYQQKPWWLELGGIALNMYIQI